MIKEKQYILVLISPGEGGEIIATGSESFVSDLRLKKIMSQSIPAERLVIREAQEKESEEEDNPEINLWGLFAGLFLSVAGYIILQKYGKKKQ